MKKNILFLIIDAMSEAYVDLDKAYSPTPFIDSLKEGGIYCTNMFSQGPYTEAALTPFYTGLDNLSNGGNLFRGDEVKKTTFEHLSDNGYDVLLYTQPLIYPRTMHRGINEERYGVAYFTSALWDYRLSYYASLYFDNKLTDIDYKNIYKLIDENFVFAIKNIEDYENKAKTYDFINLFIGPYDLDTNKTLILEEYSKYQNDKKSYLIDIFNRGSEHRLFQFAKIDMNHKADNDDLYKMIADEYFALFKKISSFNKCSKVNNENNLAHTIIKLMKAMFKLDKNECRALAKKYHYYRRIISTPKELKEMFEKKGNYKPEPSFMRYYEHFKWWLNNRDESKPFFCLMHVSDLHTPEIFFSIDSKDINELRLELSTLNAYLDTIPKNFKGNIIYLLSMRFVDLCVERIYKDFSNTPYSKNTVLMLSADHGSSFRFYPVRDSVVNNLHLENYNIPFVIYNSGTPHFVNNNYYSTKDMMSTIMYVADVDAKLPGKNIINNEPSKYMITEYLGGGCPDIYRRDIQFAYRDDEYVLFAKQPLNSLEVKPFELYKRKDDYFELNNKIKEVDASLIKEPLKILNDRLKDIKKDVELINK